MSMLYTVTVKLSREMLEKLDALVRVGVYPNRSEAIRDGIRLVLRRWQYELLWHQEEEERDQSIRD